MTIFRCNSALLLCLALIGCGETTVGQDDAICLRPKPLDVTLAGVVDTAVEQAELTKGCVHRWSYRLAKAPGPNSEIAKAVLGGCRDGVMQERNLYLDESKDGMTVAELDALKARLESDYLELALFHVVQARAGHCEIPE